MGEVSLLSCLWTLCFTKGFFSPVGLRFCYCGSFSKSPENALQHFLETTTFTALPLEVSDALFPALTSTRRAVACRGTASRLLKSGLTP